MPPQSAPRPQGEGWIGVGNGFDAYGEMRGNMGLKKILPDVHPSAVAVAQLAAPRLAAGEGIDAALAVPHYVRDKVALTTEEQRR